MEKSQRDKLRISMIGAHKRKKWGFQLGNKVMLGRKLSEKTRKLLSQQREGKEAWNKGLKMDDYNFDYVSKNGINTRWKKGETIGGKNFNWKGGQNLSYWKKAVKNRDGKCMKCGNNDHRVLTADHIKSKKMYPSLIYSIENGITLCHNCHAIKTLEDKEYRSWMSSNHWNKR